MIKSIEIWGFESHDHTLMEDLSAGFNLIFGESNAGKTSIIRAIKLVAYNIFDPKSVRVGCKECVVEVITDKGRVKVTKPSNEWEVQKHGQSTEYYEKIGKAILPDAAEIVGLSMVQLGDIEMPVNVMNQLEGHFMLSELNGKSASGSIRAQIIDEISGLSGIEGVIKEVSLDNHRWGREIKVTEDRIEELAGQLYDPKELATEVSLLDSVKLCLGDRDDCKTAIASIESLCGEVITEGDAIEVAEKELNGLPDPADVMVCLGSAITAYNIAKEGSGVSEAWLGAKRKADGIETELSTSVDTAGAEKSLQAAKTAFESVKALRKLSDTVISERRDIVTVTNNTRRITTELAEAEKERDGLFASIKVCPLTQRPIGPGGCGGDETEITPEKGVYLPDSDTKDVETAEIMPADGDSNPDIGSNNPDIETEDSDGLFDW